MVIKKAEGRRHCFDFLRVVMTFAVIITHINAQDWGSARNTYRIVFNVYHALGWIAVPVFCMISGALFLSRDIPIKKLYSKYIFRIFTAFMFWSSVYALRFYLKEGNSAKAFELFISGNYHLWFLFMIAGLYMIVPFIEEDCRICFAL